MPLREEYEATGNWLFRWRSYLPLVMVGLCALAIRGREHLPHGIGFDHHWEAFCLAVSFLGFGVRILTVGHTPRRTSGRNAKRQIAEALNTTGMYSIVRNPLYLGNFFMGLGIALFAHLWWLTLIYVLAFWLYYERIVFAEEAYLRDKFGREYLDWANQTPAFIPKLSRYRRADLPFSLRNVLRREYNGFFTVIAVMFLLETVAALSSGEGLTLDLPWRLLLCIGFTIWLTLRVLKRHTRLLEVKGR